MKINKKAGAALTGAFLLCCFQTASAAEFESLRVQNSDGQSRIVLEFDKLPESWDLKTGSDGDTELILNGISSAIPHAAGAEGNGLIKEMTPRKNTSTVTLDMKLKTEAAHHLFVLHQPDRLVLDLFTRYEEKTVVSVTPHMSYTYWTRADADGRKKIYVIRGDAETQGRIVMGDLKSRISMQSFAESTKAPVAVNGTYGGKPMMKAYGLWRNLSGQAQGFISYEQGKGYTIGLWQPAYRVSAGGKQTSVAGTDRPRRQDELILYTPSFGKSTGTNAYGKEVLVVSGRVADISTSGNMKIEEDGIVLSGIGKGAGILEGLHQGDKISVLPDSKLFDSQEFVYGGCEVILSDGRAAVPENKEEDQSLAPRTAAGVTADGKLILAEIDGWQMQSSGMSKMETALLMKELGAVQALLIPDRGMGQLLIQGKTVNIPNGGDGEGRFQTALVFF